VGSIGGHRQSGGAPLERPAKVGFKSGIGGIEQFPARDHHDVETQPSRRERRMPENLTDQAFSAISSHRVPQFAGGDDAQPGRSGVIGCYEYGEESPFCAKRQVENALEFAAAPDPAGLREALGRDGAVLRVA
jgi:hypothetical protein